MRAIFNGAISFIGDRRGNIAMMFGLMLVVIVGGAGIAIDISRATMMRTEIAEATDNAVLAAARYRANHPNADDDELTAVARKVFDSAVESKSLEISGFKVSFNADAGTFTLDVDATADALIMGLLGNDRMDVGGVAEVRVGTPPLLEVAMALDVTGSMNAKGKIGALRNAARDLVEALFESESGNVKVGVVPFAQYVNVGASYAGQTWLDAPANAWFGCVGSQDYPYNVKDSGYLVNMVPGLTGAPCPDALVPLSSDEEKLVDMIDKLDANGWTYIPSGLSWGWRLLSPAEPFAEGVSYEKLQEEDGTKALILMTDGYNTRAPDYPTHNSPSELLANDLTKEICASIKDDGIVVYTIAFDLTDTKIKGILENCATTSSHYFDAENAKELSDAFAAIASGLRNISLSK